MTIHEHKDYKQEVDRLDQTMVYAEQVISLVEGNRQKFNEEIKDAYLHLDQQDSSLSYSAIMLNSKLLDELEKNYEQLLRIRRKPYFARMDVKQDGKDKIDQLYIGKVSLYDATMEVPLVVDWRAPVASVYYDGRLGEASYKVEGDLQQILLYLKRQYTIADGVLENFMDVDISATDAFLQTSLEANAEDKMKDIVATIQAEQNAIIRADIHKPLIVQGVAGSGKTTIALHRIAYLIYTYSDTFKPENFMIIAPNTLFLDYISQVLPELGAEKVRQTTYADLMFEVLGKKHKLANSNSRLLSLIEQDYGAEHSAVRELIIQAATFKTSMHMKTIIDNYTEALKKRFVPEMDFSLEGHILLEASEIRRMFLEEYGYLPLYKRVDRVRQYLSKLINMESKRLLSKTEAGYDAKIARIRKTHEATEDRRLMIVELIDKRDAMLEQLRKGTKTAVSKFMKHFPKENLLYYYRKLVLDVNLLMQFSYGQESQKVLESMRDHGLELLSHNSIEVEDLAPLVYLKQKLFGFDDSFGIKYVVIDEAQDFSNFQFYVLKEVLDTHRFTLLGDLSQGIHMYRSIHNWDIVRNEIFDQETTYLALEQSYRTTVEIMDLANQIISQCNMEGLILAKPVVRHGRNPVIQEFDSVDSLIGEAERQILEFIQEGFGSIALIGKTIQECAAIQKHLVKRNVVVSKLVDDKETHYNHDLVVIPSYLSKGLEFDAVIVVALDAVYTPDPLDLKLLYVSMTRALHRLSVLHRTDTMPVLEGISIR